MRVSAIDGAAAQCEIGQIGSSDPAAVALDRWDSNVTRSCAPVRREEIVAVPARKRLPRPFVRGRCRAMRHSTARRAPRRDWRAA